MGDVGKENEIEKGKILIVDDNTTNVLLLEKMLQQNGFINVQSTTDSRKAVGMYEEFEPDLVLLDLNMPHMDGFAVMECLRDIESDSYAPILVLTAQNDQSVRLRALEMGAKDFLSKPLDFVEVLMRIRNMLEVRLLHNRVRMQNKLLDEKVRERTRQLADTRLEVIERLGRAAEYRDNETGMHVIRMGQFSCLLGKACGFSDGDAETILHASPMHDIGKIGIPDSILLKPGKLDHQEWEIMKSHAVIGSKILSGSGSKLMKMAESIALTHHEKWDGSGYPHGLKGEDIPIEGRIVAIADVFDALTSERPYKKAWSIEDTVAEMERISGKHFDPRLVEKFKEILPQVIEIKEKFADTEEDALPYPIKNATISAGQ